MKIGRSILLIAVLMVTQACGPMQPISSGWPWAQMEISPQIQLSVRVEPDTVAHQLREILTFRNTGSDSASVSFGACSFGLRLYPDSSPSDTPVWDDRPKPRARCPLDARVITLGPNDQRVHVVSPLHDLVARAPAPGRYRATVTWRPAPDAPLRTIDAGFVVVR